jgi:hypothetical protein
MITSNLRSHAQAHNSTDRGCLKIQPLKKEQNNGSRPLKKGRLSA